MARERQILRGFIVVQVVTRWSSAKPSFRLIFHNTTTTTRQLRHDCDVDEDGGEGKRRYVLCDSSFEFVTMSKHTCENVEVCFGG